MGSKAKSTTPKRATKASVGRAKPTHKKPTLTPKQDPVSAFLQAKLTVNAPGDAYEKEADSVADRIMQMPESDSQRRQHANSGELNARSTNELQTASLQRDELDDEDVQTQRLQRDELDDDEDVQTQRLQRDELDDDEDVQTQRLQRDKSDDDDDAVQTKATADNAPRQMSMGFESRLRHLKSSGGSPLAPSLQQFMEQRFGHSFSHVRVHTNVAAASLAQQAQARAFTVGRHLVFNKAQYQPNTDRGRRLIAHELTHVLQQKGGLHSVQREIFSPEQERTSTSSSSEDLLRRLKRLLGVIPGNLPAAIESILSSILYHATNGPNQIALHALTENGALATETRRTLHTTEYTLRIAVHRNKLGAHAEWYLKRDGEQDSFFQHSQPSLGGDIVPMGGVDEMRIAIPTPLYSPRDTETTDTEDAVTTRGVSTNTTPTPISFPSAAPPIDTTALNDANIVANENTADTDRGRGDNAGTDAPQTLRAPIDEIADEPVQEDTAIPASEIKRSSVNPSQPRITSNTEHLIRSVVAEPGSALPLTLMGEMENTLGVDLKSTRVHTGNKSAMASQALGARAFALGEHVVFGDGHYQPDTLAGKALLAHELTHVRQHRQGRGQHIAKRDAECPPPEPVPEEEVIPSPAGPSEDPAFNAMNARAENRANNQASHQSGEVASDSANAAAPVTSQEDRIHGQSDQVNSIDAAAANPPEFDREGFIQRVLAEVRRVAPELLNDVMKFSSRGRAGSIKAAVDDDARDAASDAQTPLAAATQAPVSGTSDREVQPLQVQGPGEQPGSIRADRAMPPPRTTSEVNFTAETARTENVLRDACITRPFMDEHADPELSGAAQAQDGLQEATEQAPRSYREQESSALQNAQSNASVEALSGIRDFHATRTGNFSAVGGAQGRAATDNAAKRRALSEEINQIFVTTQTNVTGRLAQMTTDVRTTFDTEANAAVRRFEEFIRINAERYDTNWAEDLWNALTSILYDPPPKEVRDFYAEGRQQFLADMETAIGKVADIVSTGLREARDKVTEGKRLVAEKLTGLDGDLAEFRSQIADQMNERFRGLESNINSQQGALVQQLGQRYKKTLEQVQSIESSVRDEYASWVDNARDMYNAAKDFVTGWIDKLSAIVGEAATRIIRNPGTFLRNLGEGIKQGLTMFIANIGDNIKGAVVTWLTGNLGSTGIELPRAFNAKGMIGFAIEIAGLGLTNIKDIARRVFGPTIVAAIEAGAAGAEKAKELFDILSNEGPAGLYDHLKEDFERLKGELMVKIGTAISQSLVIAGIRKILEIVAGLVSGGIGTIISIVATIIDVVLWFRDNASQLAQLVRTIANLALAVLNGNVTALANGINAVLKGFLPIVLSLVGALIGIGGAVRKVQGIFRAIRRPATRAITALFRKMKRGMRRLIARMRRRRGGRGRGRKMTPQAVLRLLVRAMKQPAKAADPMKALAETRRKADKLRRKYQPKLQRGTIKFTFKDTREQQITSDSDIDMGISINPYDPSATPVKLSFVNKFKKQIDNSHRTTKKDIRAAVTRVKRTKSNIKNWDTLTKEISDIPPAKKFITKPVLKSHKFGEEMKSIVQKAAEDVDPTTPLKDGQLRRYMGQINTGNGYFKKSHKLIKAQIFDKKSNKKGIEKEVKEAVTLASPANTTYKYTERKGDRYFLKTQFRGAQAIRSKFYGGSYTTKAIARRNKLYNDQRCDSNGILDPNGTHWRVLNRNGTLRRIEKRKTPQDITIEHEPPVAKHWGPDGNVSSTKQGNNMSQSERVKWFSFAGRENEVVVYPSALNSALGSGGARYSKEVGKKWRGSGNVR